jgi:chromosome segregation ATPase
MDRDIVERLREGTGPIKPNLIDDAADTIERLRARVGQLETDASALAARLADQTDTIDRLRRMVEELQIHADDLARNPSEERLMVETLTAERDEARYMLNLVIEATRDNESAKQHLESLLAKFETEDMDWTWKDGNDDPEDEEQTQ